MYGVQRAPSSLSSICDTHVHLPRLVKAAPALSTTGSVNYERASVISGSNAHLYHRPIFTPTPTIPTEDYSDSYSQRESIYKAPSEFSVRTYTSSKKGMSRFPDEDNQSIAESVSTIIKHDNVDNQEKREHSPSRDSGFSDQQQSQQNSPPLIEKEEMGSQSAELCAHLRTLVQLTTAFYQDAIEGREASRDLLDELEKKIRPIIINLDEELGAQERLLRGNLDRCKISDPRVNWLLVYNKFQLDFRRILSALSTPIFEEVEQFLRLRERGCVGLKIKGNVDEQLGEMLSTLHKTEQRIFQERSVRGSVRERSVRSESRLSHRLA